MHTKIRNNSLTEQDITAAGDVRFPAVDFRGAYESTLLQYDYVSCQCFRKRRVERKVSEVARAM